MSVIDSVLRYAFTRWIERGLAEQARSYPMAPSSGVGTVGASPGSDPARGQRHDVAELCSTTFRCFAVRADTLMMLPPRLYKGVGEQRDEVTSGGLWELINFVNPHWDWPGLIAMTEWAMCTRRNGAFWVLDAWDGQGRPHEIWYCPSDRVEIVRGTSGDDEADRYIKHYKIDMGMGQKQTFERHEVIWFRNPSPSDEFANLAALLPAMASSVLALDAMAANSMIFKQGLTGAGVVEPDKDAGKLEEPDMKALQKLLTDTLKGRQGFHRWLVLNRGGYRFTKLDLSPKDAQFVQALGLTREDVCIATGVPEPVIHPKDTTFTNMPEARGALWSNTLLPEKTRIEAAIRSQLLPLFGGEADELVLDTSAVPELQENERERWGIAKEKLAAVVDLGRRVATGDLERASALRLATQFIGVTGDVAEICIPEPALEDASLTESHVLNAAQIESAKQIVVSVAAGQLPRDSGVAMLQAFYNRPEEWALSIMGEVGSTFFLKAPAADPALPAPDATPAGEPAAGRTVLVFRDGEGYRVHDRTTSILPPPRRRAWEYDSAEHRAFMRAADSRFEDLLPDILAEVQSLFRGQRGAVLKGLEAITDADLAAIVDEVGDDPDAVAAALIDRAFDTEHWSNESLARMVDRYTPVAKTVGENTWDEVGAEGDFDAEDDGIAAAIARRADTFSSTTVATSYRQAADAVAGVLRSGGGLRDMIAAVKKTAGDWTTSRAENAARTALHGTVMDVTLETAKQTGIVEEKEWLSALDEQVRDSHKTAHGQRVALSEDFEVGDGRGAMPGMIDAAEENYQCRCVVRLIVTEGR